MIQLLTGENSYEIQTRRRRVIAEFRDNKSDEAVSIVDGTSVSVDALPQLLLGVSLFAPEKLVVIDDAAAQKSVWDKLADYLPEVGEGTAVVLVAPAADKRTRTYKWLQKNAEIIDLKPIQGLPLEQWVVEAARRGGIEIASNIARYIIEFTGGDQWSLTHDIEKLALASQPVTPQLVRELLIPNPASSAFDLLDAALAGNSGQVNELLDGVRSHEDPYRFFGLLSNQVFAVLVIAAAGNRPADTIARDSGLHPFVVKKTAPLARKLSARERTSLAEIIATTDMQLKSSGQEPWVLITAALKTIGANSKPRS